MNKIKNTIYESSIYILMLMGVSLLVTFFLFYLHISISFINFILSIVITTIIYYLLRKKLKVTDFKKSIIVSILILFISILISGFIFDRSSDGNTYHKDAVSSLKNGWNPVYESSEKFTKKYYKNTGYNMEVYSIWKDHYSKANWVLEANIYSLTNNIESAKAINLLFMYILFGIALSYFSSKLGLKKGLILSLIITINPITSAQLFTFYNDQLGLTILYTLIISLISIIDNKDKTPKFSKLFIMSICFIIALNIKFNIMGYALVFTFIFMVKYLYDNYKESRKTFNKEFKNLVILFVPLFIISIVFIGYSTYITNFIDHNNPFFPVYGEDKEDIITAQEPKEFLKYNNAEKVFYATFSKVNNLMENKKAELKIPFTIYKDEIKTSVSVDTRISGYGIIFSGILIISLLIIIFNFKKLTKKEKEIIVLLSLIIIGITFLISEGWWARYNPTMYILIIISLYIMFKYNNNLINKIFTSLVILNTLIILSLNSIYTLTESYKINKDFRKMRNKTIEYNLNYGEPIGIISNLDDFNIKYKYNSDIKDNKISYYKYLNYKIGDTSE